jgi:hypothetical protein
MGEFQIGVFRGLAVARRGDVPSPAQSRADARGFVEIA